jgi:DNA-binding transcriptional MocR family regulator
MHGDHSADIAITWPTEAEGKVTVHSYLQECDDSTLRLSFVTATVPEIDSAIALLAKAVRELCNSSFGRWSRPTHRVP